MNQIELKKVREVYLILFSAMGKEKTDYIFTITYYEPDRIKGHDTLHLRQHR